MKLLGLLLGTLLTSGLFGCADDPRTPTLTSRVDPEALVCPEHEVRYCERISAFVFGRCDCVHESLR
jgi:hypothetical protein